MPVVYLKGKRDLITSRIIQQRLRRRLRITGIVQEPHIADYLIAARMLDENFADLEEPGADENAIVASIEAPPRDIVRFIIGADGHRLLTAT
jgi:gluconate kinase